MLGWIIALISGALMSIQGVFNTGVTKQTGLGTANTFVQFTGFLLCLIVWTVKERNHIIAELWRVEPKYFLLGGVIGAGITMTVIQSMNSLGPAKAVMMIVTSQVIVAYVIELFGLFGVEKVTFHWSRLIGAVLMIGGLIIFKWKS